MKKILKYKIVSATDRNIVIQITEQSHRMNEFGNVPHPGAYPPNNSSFLATSGLRFTSCSNPAYDSAGQIYVRGSSSTCDNYEFSIPLTVWPQFYQAVNEYNAFNFGAKHSIVIDGKTIELSEESFKNLKASLI